MNKKYIKKEILEPALLVALILSILMLTITSASQLIQFAVWGV